MITITPINKALVPRSSKTAAELSSPNYDEFQNDREIWEILQRNPQSILAIKMPHCDVPDQHDAPIEGSAEALAHSTERMEELRQSEKMQIIKNLLYVYEITAPTRPNRPQIGLGCLARTKEILTDKTPQGVIIRNEGIREKKAKGRADLIRATHAFIGVVNNCVEDKESKILTALHGFAAAKTPDLEVLDEHGNRHRIWYVVQSSDQQNFIRLFAEEPYAYVADGNHRSAAAAMLGYEHFLTVFFPAQTMGICPYNRLVRADTSTLEQLRGELAEAFSVRLLQTTSPHQPMETHRIGLYTARRWLELVPKPHTYDAENAVDSLDCDIIQRQLFAGMFDIPDARDDRLTFVGSNKDAKYLQDQVDSGAYQYAITLPPVTMEQFIEVCRQRRMMPPKSTWFEPKIRSGLVIALLS